MFEFPWVAIFVMFSIPWFILLAIASFIIVWGTDDDNPALATASVFIFLLITTVFGGLETWQMIANNIPYVLCGVAGYFVLGTLWGIAKWYLYVNKIFDKYNLIKRKWLHNKGLVGCEPNVPIELKEKWSNYLKENYYNHFCDKTIGRYDVSIRVLQIHPLAFQNKGRILTWMVYWPWSLIWSLVDDVVKNIFRFIQKKIEKLLNTISERVFKSVDGDF